MPSRKGRRSRYQDSVASQPSERVHDTRSEGSSTWPHDGAPSSSYHASAGGRQIGFAYDPEETHVEPSQHEVAAELNAANLARVDEQPLVRGPLQQLEDASELIRASIHAMSEEIDWLNASIKDFQDTVEKLRRRIVEARQAGQWTEVQELETQAANTKERIKQEEQRKQDVRGRLEHGRRVVNGTLHELDLAVTHAGLQPGYPALADLADDTEGVPEEARPHLNF